VSDALRHWFERRWYGDMQPGLALRSASALFGAVVGVRRRCYRAGLLESTRLALPVLVIGNLAVGGSGKTPMTIAMVEALRQRGWRPGVISRGHGGSERGPLQLPADASPSRFGDEPCLIARRTGAPVAVARRRAEAGRLLADTADVDLLITDDGLQHYALARDVEIVMIDGRRGLGNGRLLPAGPLREPAERAAASSFRVVTGGDLPGLDAWRMSLQLDDAEALAGNDTRPLAMLAGSSVHAVAGIADPSRFFDALRSRGLHVMSHGFADHHAFRAEDFNFDDGSPLLMTEKDAVKCAAFARPNWYAVPLQATLPQAFIDQVDARLRAAKESLA
jgi:tetraacyldisaccharide 4'-kinase